MTRGERKEGIGKAAHVNLQKEESMEERQTLEMDFSLRRTLWHGR